MALAQKQLINSGILILNRDDLGKILPHQEDFQLLDSTEYDYSNPYQIIARVFLSKFNPIFRKHFPGKPVYRGIELIEMINLSAAVLVCVMENPPEEFKGGLPMSKEIRKFEFLRGVYPETFLEIKTSLEDIFTEKRLTKFLFSGRINNSAGKPVAVGQIIGFPG